MQEHIGIGIVGLGYWGPNLLRNFLHTPSCQVLFGCDLNKELLKKQQLSYPAVTFTTQFTDILQSNDVKLVAIATRTEAHYPLAKQALEAGKHVFIEKPMTSTLAQATELNELAAQRGLSIFVDHTFAFAASVQKMVEHTKAGDLGELLYFDSTRINLGIIQQDTNVLWDLAVHDLSILGQLRDLDTIKTIYATGSAHYGTQIEVGHLHLTFTDNFTAHIHVSWLSPVKIRHTILGGSKAMITYDDTDPSEKMRLYDKGVEFNETSHASHIPVYRTGDVIIPALNNKETLLVETDHIIDCMLHNKEPIVSGQEGRKIIQILERADESLASDQVVQW